MRQIPVQFVLGALLIAAWWPTAWLQWEPWSLYSFFPLWLGYILVVDGLVRVRTGTSLLTRSKAGFVFLFVVSAPGWWLFEAANARLQNWEYLTTHSVSRWEYAVRATIAFSTVVPAIFETAELWRSLPPLQGRVALRRLSVNRTGLYLLAVAGVLMMVAAILYPDWAYPLVWIGAFLALDPVNRLIGARSLAQEVAANDWSNVLALFAAGLTCGFFWEMWNSRSMPKWFYHVPIIEMPKLFEMPLLGYGGYLPFALEVFAFYQFAAWCVDRRPDRFVLPVAGARADADPPRHRRHAGWTTISRRSYNRDGREHAD